MPASFCFKWSEQELWIREGGFASLNRQSARKFVILRRRLVGYVTPAKQKAQEEPRQEAADVGHVGDAARLGCV